MTERPELPSRPDEVDAEAEAPAEVDWGAALPTEASRRGEPGTAATRLPRPAHEPEAPHLPRPDGRDRAIAAWIALLLLAALGFASFGHVDSLDAEMDFQTARALVVHRDFAVHDDNPAGSEILARGVSGHRGRGEKFYSWHGPGRAVVGAPFVALGFALDSLWPEFERLYAESPPERWVTEAQPRDLFPRLLFGLSSALFGAWTAACVYLAARVLGAARGTAAAAALALVFCTWFGPGTRSALNAVQTAFFLSLGTYLLLRYAAGEGARPLGRAGLFLAGLALGLAVWTRPTESLAVLALAGLFAVGVVGRIGHGRVLGDCLCFAGGALLIAAALVGLNLWRFGDLREFGHGDAIRNPNFLIRDPLLLGVNLLGLVASPGKGALWFAPALFLLPLALGGHAGRYRLARLCLGIAALCFFVWPILSSGWHGAAYYGARYVTPALPLLAILLARPLGRWWGAGGWRRGALAVSLVAGFVVQVPGFLVHYRTAHELAALSLLREIGPMPEEYLIAFAGVRHVDAARWAAMSEDERRQLERDAEYAFDNEQRQIFAQFHPAYFPPHLLGTILWHRLVGAQPAEEERLALAWIHSPFAPPLDRPARAGWSPPASVSADDAVLRPSGLEMRGWLSLWPFAFAERFAGFPLREFCAGFAAAFLLAAAGLAWTLRRADAMR